MSRNRWHPAWTIVAITAAILLLSSGVRSAPGVLILPFEHEFGWGRSSISLAISLGLVLFGLTGPIAGALIDRHGPRRIMLGGVALIAVSSGLGALIAVPWHLYLTWGALSGIGTGIIGSVLGATVANRWFVAQRGLVLGIFGAATSAGQLVFIPLLMALVTDAGWRTSVWLLAVLAGLAMLPAWWLMRDAPADVGLLPYGATAALPPATRSHGGVMHRAIRTPAFWLLSATFFVCGATSNGLIGTHLIPHAIEHGIGQSTAAGALALMGAMNFVGTIASGWLTDRYSPRRLLAVYYGVRGLSLLGLPWVTDPAGLMLFAILFGLDYIATVPPTSALVADIFGREHVGRVFGWVFCAHQIGAALAAWAGGAARERIGDYAAAFIVAGVMAITAAVLASRISRAPAVARAPDPARSA
ncbi:MAG: MFS transporter [Chloroflexi bacterium]|nr:MFS transporter [Chloroflexota bacterium]